MQNFAQNIYSFINKDTEMKHNKELIRILLMVHPEKKYVFKETSLYTSF